MGVEQPDRLQCSINVQSFALSKESIYKTAARIFLHFLL